MTPTEAADREQIRRFQDRLRVVSEAARTFAEATTDYTRLLDGVARTLSDVLKDACSVFLLTEDAGRVQAVALHANEPLALEQIRQMFLGAPLVLAEQPALRNVLETGRSFLVPRVDSLGPREDTTPGQVTWQRKLGLHSFLVVALRARGRAMGVLTLGRFRPGAPPFDEDDRELAEGLAVHASLAIENAQLYAAAQDARRLAERAEEVIRKDHAERLRAQAALDESEGRLRRTLDSMLEGYTILGRDLRYLYVNETGARHARLAKEELLGRTPMELFPDFESTGMHALLRRCLQENTPVHTEEELTHRDGTKAFFEVRVQPTPEGLVILSMDTTEHRRTAQARESLEEQLRQSQKMDAVGRLAGGVAHDFNNLLSVILGYGESVLLGLGDDDPIRADVEEINKAARRAAELTRQLLMFSRQQVIEAQNLDLNAVLRDMEKMLRRILGEQLQLTVVLEPTLGHVRADRGNIEQVIMNLMVNARDAMPTGGKLTIETENVVLDESFVRVHLGTEPGPYVLLAVTDTGIGMDRATRLRIFEPFFTTKGPGQGTGLGLSTVFGIVKQSGGGVWVYSEPGRGTTFKVYLPRVEEAAHANPQVGGVIPFDLRGSETILLVEDEEAVRIVARRILERYGYQVQVAQNASEAFALLEQRHEPVHLLLTDVVMPFMSGAELAAQLLARWPDLKVLYMSGYTGGSVVSHGPLETSASFLQKPFTSESLARKVRSVLDAVVA